MYRIDLFATIAIIIISGCVANIDVINVGDTNVYINIPENVTDERVHMVKAVVRYPKNKPIYFYYIQHINLTPRGWYYNMVLRFRNLTTYKIQFFTVVPRDCGMYAIFTNFDGVNHQHPNKIFQVRCPNDPIFNMSLTNETWWAKTQQRLYDGPLPTKRTMVITTTETNTMITISSSDIASFLGFIAFYIIVIIQITLLTRDMRGKWMANKKLQNRKSSWSDSILLLDDITASV